MRLLRVSYGGNGLFRDAHPNAFTPLGLGVVFGTLTVGAAAASTAGMTPLAVALAGVGIVLFLAVLLIPMKVSEQVCTNRRRSLSVTGETWSPGDIIDRWGHRGPQKLNNITVEIDDEFDPQRDWIVTVELRHGLIPIFRTERTVPLLGPVPGFVPARSVRFTMRESGWTDEMKEEEVD